MLHGYFMILLQLHVLPLIKGRLTQRQREREKYASMREIYQQKKAEKEAARNNIENIGIIFFKIDPCVSLLTQNALSIRRCCVCD